MPTDEALARQRGIAVGLVDGRSIPATPTAVLNALHPVAPHPGGAESVDRPGDQVVILVDSYEWLEPLDAWVRDELLPPQRRRRRRPRRDPACRAARRSRAVPLPGEHPPPLRAAPATAERVGLSRRRLLQPQPGLCPRNDARRLECRSARRPPAASPPATSSATCSRRRGNGPSGVADGDRRRPRPPRCARAAEPPPGVARPLRPPAARRRSQRSRSRCHVRSRLRSRRRPPGAAASVHGASRHDGRLG